MSKGNPEEKKRTTSIWQHQKRETTSR